MTVYIDNLTKSETGNTITRVSKWVAEDGTAFFDIRKFYKTKNADEFKPGKGISLPLTVEALDALIDAANAAKVDIAKAKVKARKEAAADKPKSGSVKAPTEKPRSTLKRVGSEATTPTKPKAKVRIRVGVKK